MIRLEQINAGYYGKAIIKDVTMEFRPGEVMVLLGPNGSGKSTLLRAALGLLPLQRGKIFYHNKDIENMKRKEIARQAAFLTQSRNTPSIQALRMVLHGRFPYVSYPRKYSKEDYEIARQAMKMTGCAQYEDRNLSELSGGQRQSVYLAMALAQKTETIFMDEPTTFLDIHRQIQMMQIAQNLAKQGKSVVLVLHDLSMALQCADRIAVLDEGKLQCCDTKEKVFQSGVLDHVFHIRMYRMESPHGTQYYYVPKE